MPGYFKAVAVDFDGTLTTGERPDANILAALHDTRAQGLRLILVTGRMLDHLRRGFPDVDDWFDAVVGENGAVVATPNGTRPLAAPVSRQLIDAVAA